MLLRTISGPENAGGHTIARLTKCLVRRGSNVFKPTTHPGSNEKPILVKKKKRLAKSQAKLVHVSDSPLRPKKLRHRSEAHKMCQANGP